MLANSFQTPAQLNITPTEHRALVGVLGMLERGELRHVPHRRITHFPDPGSTLGPGEVPGFNMNFWTARTECGTVVCLGGACQHLFGEHFAWVSSDQMQGLRTPLTRLFFPADNYDATECQAATALRTFLTTGEPHWAEAMGQ